MEDTETGELRDYKFFCFNGEPKVMYVATGRGIDQTKFDYYDMEFNHLDITQKYPNTEIPNKKPNCFNEMIVLAEKLSLGIPHVRVDLYEVNGKIYFFILVVLYHLNRIIGTRYLGTGWFFLIKKSNINCNKYQMANLDILYRRYNYR